MKGKLIIIESGSDASGKATQANELYSRLLLEKSSVRKVEFPNYKSESSSLVKMYLKGCFGTNPEDVSPYVASTFYAADRYASYKTDWENFYRSGGIIVSDRYTTSNMVHQAAKLEESEKEKFLEWLWDLEFNIYKLPKPDCVIFLDMPPKFSQELIRNRRNKITGNYKKDIHENNEDFLIASYNNAVLIAEKYKWKKVNCVQNGKLKTIKEIHEDVYNIVKTFL